MYLLGVTQYLRGCMRGEVVKLGRLNKSHPVLRFYKIVLYYFVVV